MDSVIELQNDFSVIQREASLTFPRAGSHRLYMVTNQNTQIHLLNNSSGGQRTEGGKNLQKKSIFQHGVSTKVFSVMDPTEKAWEVRLLLNSQEYSRLSSSYNFIGFVSMCLTTEKNQEVLSSLCDHCARNKTDMREFCKAAGQFLCCSNDDLVSDYCEKLNKILLEKLGASCTGQEKMVAGALVALAAAELATSVQGINTFDYKVGKKITQDNQNQQIHRMMEVFDVMAELLTVPHQKKKVQIIFRNPCPDNWASGGKKLLKSKETLVFGLCHKVVSISEEESEIQFLQSLQESYHLVSVFHLAAFVEHLLMTSSWRKKIERFLKEQDKREEIIHDLSSLAGRFISSAPYHQRVFLKDFQSEMLAKWSSVEALEVGDEAVCAFGILLAIFAALTAKSSVDRVIPDSEEDELPGEVEDTSVSTAPAINVSNGSSNTSINDSVRSGEAINQKVNSNNGEAQSNSGDSPDAWVKVEYVSSEVGADTVSIYDPETPDQGIISGSRPLTEPTGDRTQDTQETKNDADDNSAKYSCDTDYAQESNPTSTEIETFPPSVSAQDNDDQEKDKGDADGNVTKDLSARVYTQGSGSTSPETEEGPPDVSTQDNDDQELNKGGADGNFDKLQSNTTSQETKACPLGVSTLVGSDHDVDNDKHDTFPGERAYPQGFDPTSPDIEEGPPGVRTLDNAHQEIDKDDALGNYGKYPGDRAYPQGCDPTNPETEGPGVRALDISDHDIDKDDTDRNYDKYPGEKDNTQGSGPTSLETEEGLHRRGRGAGSSLDDANDDGANRVSEPPNEGAQVTVLETQNSSSKYPTFNRSFIGVMCLLVVVALLTMVLPQSVSSVLIAITLGALVVKWLTGRHP